MDVCKWKEYIRKCELIYKYSVLYLLSLGSIYPHG